MKRLEGRDQLLVRHGSSGDASLLTLNQAMAGLTSSMEPIACDNEEAQTL